MHQRFTASHHVWKRIFCLSFCVCPSVRTVISRSIHLAVNFVIQFFIAECFFIVYLHCSSGMDMEAAEFPRHCGLAVVNVDEQVSLVGYRLLENKPKAGIARWHGRSVSSLLRKPHSTVVDVLVCTLIFFLLRQCHCVSQTGLELTI